MSILITIETPKDDCMNAYQEILCKFNDCLLLYTAIRSHHHFRQPFSGCLFLWRFEK
ncbi:MAG: hypothetical protein J5680_06375 [Neisseriaceae bacterium]|nr:hypothetical protein [Neisseriaceae bacterium]